MNASKILPGLLPVLLFSFHSLSADDEIRSAAPLPDNNTIVVEAEECDLSGSSMLAKVNPRKWASGGAVVTLKSDGAELEAVLSIEAPADGDYTIVTQTVAGKGLEVQFLVDGEPLGEPRKLTRFDNGIHGRCKLTKGPHALTYRALGEGEAWIDTIQLRKEAN